MKIKPCALFLGALLSLVATAEPYRPQFHFTPKQNWMNDPNGLVYYAGEYHLFYQYNPFGINHGNMSWGHAVSRDLVRWEELSVAIPMAGGVQIYSGSAVIDWNNSSGFQTGNEPPMIAIYTGAGAVQDQRIAYSNDRGRTWTNYSGNPVIDIGSGDFRDPKVIWHPATLRWVMVVALPGQRKIRFYTSTDLKSWTQASEFGPAGSVAGVWECPDFFPMKVEGTEQTKWVLTNSNSSGGPGGGSGIQYFTGDFDGTTFTADPTPPLPPLPNGILLADFEGSDYSGWTATGTCFGSGPASGTLPNQQLVSGYRGNKLVNTFLSGDGSTGTLTSPPFTVTKPYLNFLIGGGSHPGQTCINLRVNGNIVRTATGEDRERLNWKNWDLTEFIGQQALIEIVDSHTGGWGHVNIDHILMADSIIAPEPDPAHWIDHGPDQYAGVSWSDIPAADGRRLWISWMTDVNYAGSIPTSPWRGSMTLPRELVLRQTPLGLRIAQLPVAELGSCRGNHLSHGEGTFTELNAWLAGQQIPQLFELQLELEVPANEVATLRIGDTTEHSDITWDRAAGSLLLDRRQSGLVSFTGGFASTFSAPLQVNGNRLKLRAVMDASALEVFGDGGLASLTCLVFPQTANRALSFTGPPAAKLISLDLWEMGSALPTPFSDAQLLGSWSFDESTPGTYAEASGSGYDMTSVSGLAPAVTNGVAGNAMEIRKADPGSNGVMGVDAVAPLMADSFSVSYHFNPKANDNVKLPQLGWSSPAGLAWGLEILANRRMNFYVFDSDFANDVQSVAQLPFEAYNASGGSADNLDNDPAWHHVAASYDATTGKLTLWLDGVKAEKTGTGLAGRPRYGTPEQGGGLRSGSGLTIYDELRIYGGLLDDDDVAALRATPTAPLPPSGSGLPAGPSPLRMSRYGSSIFVDWPAGTGCSLWKSEDLSNWSKVPGSEALSTYGTVISSEPQSFFRLLPP